MALYDASEHIEQQIVSDVASDTLVVPALSLVSEPRRITVYERLLKRPLDVLLSAILLVLLSPVLLVISIVVAVHLGRPVFFHQVRVGRNGRRFSMLKFRTMRHDRRTADGQYRGENRRSLHKCDTDPRHTNVGRFLRSTSLDELPQLAQVLSGDLSLVGPRPEIWAEAEEKGRLGLQREQVRPGITGPWQVYSRDSTDVEGRLRFDDDYVQEVTLRQDLTLLGRTVMSIANRTGH